MIQEERASAFNCLDLVFDGSWEQHDFSQDKGTRVRTLVKQYGIKDTARLTGLCLVLGFIMSAVAYSTHEFSCIYLYLDIPFIILGLVFTALFVSKPTPRLALLFTYVFMIGGGLLIILAMILGKGVYP